MWAKYMEPTLVNKIIKEIYKAITILSKKCHVCTFMPRHKFDLCLKSFIGQIMLCSSISKSQDSKHTWNEFPFLIYIFHKPGQIISYLPFPLNLHEIIYMLTFSNSVIL
jgi:hypothetical protein